MTETMKPVDTACPNCQSQGMQVFYELRQVPVHSVLLLTSRQEAQGYTKGDIVLGFCPACGFISNLAFVPEVHEYSDKYEPTQGYSATFNAFHQRLAENLIERYDLRGKKVIEIGCGQGEFLNLLCRLGGNQGIGFDPAYVGRPEDPEIPAGVTFVQDFYSEKYTHHQADLVACKMTLEHIQDTTDFVRTVRKSIGDHLETKVFFQVPNARYVFGDLAFWDIYYEHCSYFSLGSIARLFRQQGFDVVDLWTDYDDQYLMIDAVPITGSPQPPLPQEADLVTVTREVERFAGLYPPKLAAWRSFFEQARAGGRKVVLWGGGSKAVAFLTTLNIQVDTLAYAVDINPRKSGTFIAGTGQAIVHPSFLQEYRPDLVIVMNPVYCDEVRRNLTQMGLSPQLMAIDEI